MASSNASAGAPFHHSSHEEIVPLESVFTGEPSGPSYDHAASASADLEVPTPQSAIRQYHIQRAVLGRLKAWHQWEIDRYNSLTGYILSKVGFPKRPICPSPEEVLSLATYFFPQRRSLRVVVCDFGEGRFDRFEISLENVQRCMVILCSWCEDLILRHCTRLGGQTNVGDCTVDVCFSSPNTFDATDVRRHIPIGSSSLESVRQHFIPPLRYRIARVN